MEEEIRIFEEVRSYILGEMSPEEAAAFEEKIAKDDKLRREYENIRQVGHAVTKVHSEEAIRAHIEKMEIPPVVDSPSLDADLQELERELVILDGKEPQKRFSLWDKIRAWFSPDISVSISGGDTLVFNYSYASRLGLSLAVVAAIMIAIIVPINLHLGSMGYNYAPSFLELQTFRGDNEEPLEEAIDLYNKGEYRDAEVKFEQVINDLDHKIEQLGESDTDILNKMTLTAERQEAEWYCALTYMKNREVRKAKKLLKSVSQTESRHADEALRILNEVY